MTTPPARVPAGHATGGQFAATPRPEAHGIDLTSNSTQVVNRYSSPVSDLLVQARGVAQIDAQIDALAQHRARAAKALAEAMPSATILSGSAATNVRQHISYTVPGSVIRREAVVEVLGSTILVVTGPTEPTLYSSVTSERWTSGGRGVEAPGGDFAAQINRAVNQVTASREYHLVRTLMMAEDEVRAARGHYMHDAGEQALLAQTRAADLIEDYVRAA